MQNSMMVSDASMARLALEMDIQHPISSKCKTCGDTGFVYLFLASDGPFDHPGNPYLGTSEHPIVSRYHNGKWWLGETKSYRCEDCNIRPRQGE